MWDILYYLLIMLLLAGAVIAAGYFGRAYLEGSLSSLQLFSPRPERRLDVVEQSNIDGRRKLILVRRDDVEHLIMTGGPVDVVIETGIGAAPQTHAGVNEGTAAVFPRTARAIGKAVGEK